VSGSKRSYELVGKFVDILDSITEWSGKIVSWAVLPMLAVLIYEVISRKFFNDPTVWAYDTSTQLQMLLVLGGSAYTLRERGHISIDVISTKFSQRLKAIIDIIFILLLLICSVVIIWYGGAYAWNAWSIQERSSSYWAPPVYQVKTIMPICGVLLLFAVFPRLRGDINMLKRDPSKEQMKEHS
jgi:TRAP-type mannitol/chloroaromatic compound transport system permease small subunit